MKHVITSLLLLALTAVAAAQTIYVKHNATGLNNGTSWTDAYTNLQAAIDSAAPGSELWVAAGCYIPDKKVFDATREVDKTFLITKSLNLYGGFNGTETDKAQRSSTDTTTLSGRLNDSTNTLHVMVLLANESDSITIDRFKITEGDAQLDRNVSINIPDSLGMSETTLIQSDGGAIYGLAEGSARITVTASYLTNNRAGQGAISIYLTDSSQMVIDNNCFYKNSARLGAAIDINSDSDYVYHPNFTSITITNNLFQENSAYQGRAIYTVALNARIDHNQFTSNDGLGSCIYMGISNHDYDITIDNNHFSKNNAEYENAVIAIDGFNDSAKGRLELKNNQIINNKNCTGIYISNSMPLANRNKREFNIINNTISDNLGGISIQNQYGNTTIADNTITNNIGTVGVFIAGDTNVLITRNKIVGNKNINANQNIFGGGLYVRHSASIIGNYIAYNSAPTGGGCYINQFIYSYDYTINSVILKNNLIIGNTANKGSGIYIDRFSEKPIHLANNTLIDNNLYSDAPDNSTIQAHNNLIWGKDTNNFVYNNKVALILNNNLIQGQTAQALNAFGTGNIDGTAANPRADATLLFKDTANADYSLAITSQCINAGSSAHYLNLPISGDSVDMAGEKRIFSNIDIGAYEFQFMVYRVEAKPNNNAYGVTTGSGYYLKDSIATVTATPNGTYLFDEWRDTLANTIDQNNTLSFAVTKDTTLIAWFEKDISYEDARLLTLEVNQTAMIDAPTNHYSGHYEGSCGQATFQIEITIPQGAHASIPQNFTYTMKQIAGYDTINFTITSRNGANTTAHTLIVERRLPFDTYIKTLWKQNTFMLDIRQLRMQEVDITYTSRYQWYKDNSPIPGKIYPTYSAGPNAQDAFQVGSEYYLKITTEDGQVIRSCVKVIQKEAEVQQEQTELEVYPSPTACETPALITIANIGEEELKAAKIEVYNTLGQLVQTIIPLTENTPITIKQPGIYTIRLTIHGKTVDTTKWVVR